MGSIVCERFDWDAANVAHIGRHDVTQGEVVEAMRDVGSIHATHSVRFGEKRYSMLGRTTEGRLLFVAYTLRSGAIRPVTAYTASRKDQRIYEARR